MRPIRPFQRVSGATYPCKTPPTARKISSVSAVPQLARLSGGWCRLELSGLGKRRSSFWRKSSTRKVSGDSGGFEFRAFIDFFDAYEQVLREGCFTPSRVSTMMPISLHPLPLQ